MSQRPPVVLDFELLWQLVSERRYQIQLLQLTLLHYQRLRAPVIIAQCHHRLRAERQGELFAPQYLLLLQLNLWQ